ncbi:MAG: hypothetical protein JNG85_00205, partial [Spirochaetaceae bacterium]|nr:hypothetical protein [Spirochaetaceae bacterium]
LPDISVGASWNRVNGMVKTSVGSAQTFTITLPNTDIYDITAAAPKVGLEWAANTYDFNLQVSKKLLFILTPYVGAGYSMGPGTVKAGVFSSVTGTKTVAGPTTTVMTQADFDALNAYLSANGYPTVSQTEGLVFTGDAAKTLRIYGGFSLNILLALDCQVMYVPDTKQLGASVSARIQL